MEDFEYMSDSILHDAIKKHRQRSKYWPTSAELLELADWDMRVAAIQQRQISYNQTDEEIAENLNRVKALTAEIFNDDPSPDGHAEKVKAQARAILRGQ